METVDPPLTQDEIAEGLRLSAAYLALVRAALSGYPPPPRTARRRRVTPSATPTICAAKPKPSAPPEAMWRRCGMVGRMRVRGHPGAGGEPPVPRPEPVEG